VGPTPFASRSILVFDIDAVIPDFLHTGQRGGTRTRLPLTVRYLIRFSTSSTHIFGTRALEGLILVVPTTW
jgi:hypothetical protein